jgi:hypothetical protein
MASASFIPGKVMALYGECLDFFFSSALTDFSEAIH